MELLDNLASIIVAIDMKAFGGRRGLCFDSVRNSIRDEVKELPCLFEPLHPESLLYIRNRTLSWIRHLSSHDRAELTDKDITSMVMNITHGAILDNNIINYLKSITYSDAANQQNNTMHSFQAGLIRLNHLFHNMAFPARRLDFNAITVHAFILMMRLLVEDKKVTHYTPTNVAIFYAIALMLSHKVLLDKAYTNSAILQILKEAHFNVPNVQILTQLEMAFASRLDFKLFVDSSIYQRYMEFLLPSSHQNTEESHEGLIAGETSIASYDSSEVLLEDGAPGALNEEEDVSIRRAHPSTFFYSSSRYVEPREGRLRNESQSKHCFIL